jgi:hypothetical protein
MKEKNLLIMKLVLNIIIVILEIVGFVLIYQSIGWNMLMYYTELSNFMLLTTSLIACYKLIMMLRGNMNQECKVFNFLRYTACLSITVTFLVVLTILGPIYPTGYYGILLEGSMLYHHLLCPLIFIFMFIFLEKYDLSKKDAFRAVYFTLIYAAVMLSLNFFKVVDGPYPFLRVHNQSVLESVLYLVLMIGGAIGLSYLIRLANQKLCIISKTRRKKDKKESN